MGLSVTVEDADRSLDELKGWDSVYLLWLLTLLERRTGRSVALADVLDAGSLEQIYRVAVAA